MRWAVGQAVLVGGLCTLAGTWRDPWLWAFIAVVSAVALYAATTIDHGLVRERLLPRGPGADRWSLLLIRIFAIAHLIVGALDTGRWQIAPVDPALRAAGIAGYALSFLLVVRAMRTNRFFSAAVRVQTERGHHVVESGPYRFIRHPGYAGMIPAMPFSGLALGSWLAVALALAYSAIILRRVSFEDRFLHEHLPGYSDYATRVRYKLLPRTW